MTDKKEIELLHSKGFVILQAQRVNNSPIGWKRKTSPSNKKAWGYAEEMADPLLTVYHSTFNADILARSHCGFYLGHGNLCCIDLDTKKTTIETTTKLKDKLVEVLGTKCVVETTKSNGYHIYFLYDKRLDNCPDWMGLKEANWIELYYAKRFIACYLSNSKKYTLVHGDLTTIKPLSSKDHAKLLEVLTPYKGKNVSQKRKTKKSFGPVDAETWEQAEAYVKQLEEKGLDITGANPTWVKIGMGFANAFGEKGFEMFDRLSRFSPLYNADTIKDDYTRFVNGETNSKSKVVTIASFFKMCDDNGLVDNKTLQTLKLHPASTNKEFELTLSKKERMPEHVHTLVTAFLQHVEICCIDQAYFYVFEHTHWVKRNSREVVDMINNFVDRSDVEDRYRKLLRTLPYLDMAIRELKLITMREALEPHTGNLKEGIFINMENGVLHVDMKTGKRKLLDHDSKYNFTTILPFCYEPLLKSPRFDTWMNTQIPDSTLHEAYYAFVASCLTRHKADIIMLLAGETSTGKSSLIDITRRLIGLENSVAVSAGILFGGTSEAQTQAMQMENKLLAYDFDSQPFKHLEMLLKVAAQEPLPGWQMHVARRPVINYGRLLIAMNPYNYSVFNPAVARRFITINMDVPVIKDNNVMPAIYENELAGIFNHVLNVGVRHLLENNGQIKITDSMRKATLDFHTKQKDSSRWFETRYVLLKPSMDKSNRLSIEEKLQRANPDASITFITITEMYMQYRAWLVDEEGWNENKLPMRKHFAADLKLIGVEDYIVQVGKSELKKGLFLGVKKH
jgi:hypothetical protein